MKTTIYGWASKLFLGVIIASVVQPALIDGAFGAAASYVKAWSALAWFILSGVRDYHTQDKPTQPTDSK